VILKLAVSRSRPAVPYGANLFLSWTTACTHNKADCRFSA